MIYDFMRPFSAKNEEAYHLWKVIIAGFLTNAYVYIRYRRKHMVAEHGRVSVKEKIAEKKAEIKAKEAVTRSKEPVK